MKQRGIKAVLKALLVGALLCTPLWIYLGLTQLGLTVTALLLGVAAGSSWLLSHRSQSKSPHVAPGALFGVYLAVVVASLLFDRRGYLLLLPTAINLVLLVTFAATLTSDQPLVERLARMVDADLSLEEQRYCRSVTWVWCGFFWLNGSVALFLAMWAPLAWWSLYNGLIAYLLMALLFAAEYALRKYRFRRFSSLWHDQLLKRLLPPATPHK